MPCNLCKLQFNLFKRKRSCVSCHFYYCGNCLGKRRKNFCIRCEIILISSSKNELMLLKTKDLIFFLQSRKVNISGVVEKEELCNLITNHVNSNSYYETVTSNSSSPLDFENYSHQIKQTCQSFFTSMTDKIATDLQKTTCFNQASQNKKENVTINQPKASGSSQVNITNPLNCEASTSSCEMVQNGQFENASYIPHSKDSQNINCECCSEQVLAEISEKRQSIFNEDGSDLCNNAKKAKIEDTTSDSSFEEVVESIQKCDDDWQFIENEKLDEYANNNKTIQLNLNETSNQNQQSDNNESSSCENLVDTIRRKSDSSLVNLKKSFDNVDISTSSNFNGQIANIKICCKKCGKSKSKITEEIIKLNEQLKSSHRTEKEISAKIKQFIDYLDTKLESTEAVRNEVTVPLDSSGPSTSVEQSFSINDSNSENIGALSNEESNNQPSCSFNTSKRFITLEDLQSSSDLDYLSVKQLKELLALNRVDFKGCCEKQELKERVQRLWESYSNALPSDRLSTNDLCKICMDAPIECVFLDCGHSVSCISCGKVLNECPICRSYIVRVVRIFKS